jgi:hypothetical protein
MLKGWRDFSHYVQIMKGQREAVEVVVHDWNMLVKRRVFGSIKERFHKPAYVEEQCARGDAHHMRMQLRCACATLHMHADVCKAEVHARCVVGDGTYMRTLLRRWRARAAVRMNQAKRIDTGTILGDGHFATRRVRLAFSKLVARKNTHHTCVRERAQLRERVLLGVTGGESWFR